MSIWQKSRVLGLFSIYKLYFWLVGSAEKKSCSPDSQRRLKKKGKKKTRYYSKTILERKIRSTPPLHNIFFILWQNFETNQTPADFSRRMASEVYGLIVTAKA